MTFRRLSLILALLTAPASGDDYDDVTRPSPGSRTDEGVPSQAAPRRTVTLEDLLLRSDGSIAGLVSGAPEARSFVPWSLVRLALGTLAEGDASEPPVWVAIAPRPADRDTPRDRTAHGALVPLTALAGTAVTGPRGEAIGAVRGALVSLATGIVPALAIEVGASLGVESRTVAVPWSALRLPIEGVAVVASEIDLAWIHSAPAVDLVHRLGEAAIESGLHGERFSPRFEPAPETTEVVAPWLERNRRG